MRNWMQHKHNYLFVLLFVCLIGMLTWTATHFQSTSFPYFQFSSKQAPIPLTIGIVDLNHIKTNSKVFLKFNNELEGLNAKIHKEILERETKLHGEFEQFKKNQPIDKEPSRETIKQKADLDKKVADLEKIVKERRESLEKEFTSRLLLIKETLQDLLSDLATSHGLKIILNKALGESTQMDQSIILFSAPELDLTQEVIKRLDKKLLT
jgi:Skp family chaperone for outer membrane proteins